MARKIAPKPHYRPAKRRISPSGTELSPAKIVRRGEEVLSNEIPGVVGKVKELVNHWGEVWHRYRFEWPADIPVDADTMQIDGGGVFDARRAFEAVKPFFNRYRGEAMLLAHGVRADHRGIITDQGWLSVSHTATLQLAYERLSFGLAKIDANVHGGSKRAGSGGSDCTGVVGIEISVECPKWYGKLSARQEKKTYHRRSKRQLSRESARGKNKGAPSRPRKAKKRSEGKKKHRSRR